MLTSSSAVTPITTVSKPIATTVNHVAETTSPVGKFDNVSISADNSNSFHMNLVSRLAHEVRTATTTADIRELRQAVSSGEYTPDPKAIACKMLFLMEE